MARCGCNTIQSTTCEAIISCIVANLGTGLDYNEATRRIDLDLSGDAGNSARVGNDGGLWAPALGGEPIPRQWPKTVAGLPAEAIGGNGGGNLVAPSTDPRLIEYDVAQGLDLYATLVVALADEVAFEAITDHDSDLSRYTDSPGGISYGDLGSPQLGALVYDTGTRLSPTNAYGGTPDQFLTPDGGWAGFYSQPFRLRSIAELLRIVRGRMVVMLRGERGRSDVDSARDVAAAVRAVVEAGAQDWVIIAPNVMNEAGGRTPLADLVQMVTDAGITAGANVFREDQGTDPFSPAEIAATGAQWVTLGSVERGVGMTEARISEFTAAGLQVEATTGGRHYWTRRMFDLGCRAVTAIDPVYARGGRGEPGDLSYRQSLIPGLSARTTAVGALTPKTDQQSAVFNAGFARQDEPGRWFPPRYGWQDGTVRWENHQLLGTIGPYPNTTDYRIRIRARCVDTVPASSNQHVGIFFAMPDDHDFSSLAGGGSANPNGYYAAITRESSSSGFHQLFLRRFTGGFVTLASEEDTISLPSDSWADLEVIVQGSSITFNATVDGTTRTLSAEDDTHRGAYAAYAWRDEAAGSIPGFIHGYDNPVDMGMYEALS